jgi:hypothetical protein
VAKHRFIYYLYDDRNHEERFETLANQVNSEVADVIASNRSFNEVKLECEYDEFIDEVTIISATNR